MRLGNRTFYKDEPVLLFDTLTTSSLEGAVTTVYAQGGRGNSRLMAWDGERTVTFNMEDALISPEGLSILAGAELIDAAKDKPINVHKTASVETNVTGKGTSTNHVTQVTMKIEAKVYGAGNETDTVYVFPKNGNGDIHTEPYIPTKFEYYYYPEGATNSEPVKRTASGIKEKDVFAYTLITLSQDQDEVIYPNNSLDKFAQGIGYAYVDFYEQYTSDVMQINITADQFGSNFYIEAATLFKDEKGTDHPAEFIIPNGKIQSNFTFSLAASGDPSTFAFTVDAFPDYTRFDQSKKVLSAIQVIGATVGDTKEYTREATVTSWTRLDQPGPKGNIDTDPEGLAEG